MITRNTMASGTPYPKMSIPIGIGGQKDTLIFTRCSYVVPESGNFKLKIETLRFSFPKGAKSTSAKS